MQPHEVIIPIVFFLVIAAVVGSIVLTRHKERMSMIEKGMKSDEIKSLYQRPAMNSNPLSALKWGMVLVCVGVAIMLGIWLRETFFITNEGIFPGLIATFGGVGLVLFYFISSRKKEQM